MKGRKKKNYRPAVKSYNCGDIVALEICKKKRINISAELTRALQRIAYSADNLKQAEILMIEKLNVLQEEKERALNELENKYTAEIRTTAQDLAKVQQKIKVREAADRGL